MKYKPQLDPMIYEQIIKNLKKKNEDLSLRIKNQEYFEENREFINRKLNENVKMREQIFKWKIAVYSLSVFSIFLLVLLIAKNR